MKVEYLFREFREGPQPGFHPKAIEVAQFPESGERLTMIVRQSGLREEGALYIYEGPARTFQYRDLGGGGYRRLKRARPNSSAISLLAEGKKTRMYDALLEEMPWDELGSDEAFVSHFMHLVYAKCDISLAGPDGTQMRDVEVLLTVPFDRKKDFGARLLTFDRDGFHKHS